MQIKLYGNGHSCDVPVQEIIDKYWKNEGKPFSFEVAASQSEVPGVELVICCKVGILNISEK